MSSIISQHTSLSRVTLKRMHSRVGTGKGVTPQYKGVTKNLVDKIGILMQYIKHQS